MQNNKPTEVVYDASNCLVLLYTVNNLLYGQREEIQKIFTSGRKIFTMWKEKFIH